MLCATAHPPLYVLCVAGRPRLIGVTVYCDPACALPFDCAVTLVCHWWRWWWWCLKPLTAIFSLRLGRRRPPLAPARCSCGRKRLHGQTEPNYYMQRIRSHHPRRSKNPRPPPNPLHTHTPRTTTTRHARLPVADQDPGAGPARSNPHPPPGPHARPCALYHLGKFRVSVRCGAVRCGPATGRRFATMADLIICYRVAHADPSVATRAACRPLVPPLRLGVQACTLACLHGSLALL